MKEREDRWCEREKWKRKPPFNRKRREKRESLRKRMLWRQFGSSNSDPMPYSHNLLTNVSPWGQLSNKGSRTKTWKLHYKY